MTFSLTGLQRVVARPLLLLSFFISFAAFNFEDANWGLQVSWVFGLIFCLSYIPTLIARPATWRLFRDRRFLLAARLLLILFGTTLLAWLCVWADITELPDDGPAMLRRSFGHTGYLSFFSVVFVCVYHFLRSNHSCYWTFFRWVAIYPFMFISAWGVYQFLTTFDSIEYLTIFNNSLSTGFTYERFKDAHRVSSVFPEPSEYSYYLAFMTPIVWACFRRQLPPDAYRARRLLLLLLATQIITIQSLSYFVALPVVAYVIIRHVERIGGLRTIFWLGLSTTVLVSVAGIGLAPRLGEVASGSDGSTVDRLVGLLEALDLWQRSPIVGFGYGIVRGLDGLSFLLASLGTAGFLAFATTLWQFIVAVRKHASPILAGALIAMIAGFISSNNVLSHIFVWVLLATLAACPKIVPPQKVGVRCRRIRPPQQASSEHLVVAG